MLTREEVKAIVDKVINMAGADAVEVNVTGGERSGTRWANSSITTNLVQYDRQVTATVRFGQKSGNANTRDFSDAGLKAMVDEAVVEAREAEEDADLTELLGPQEYIAVDAALPDLVNYGPAERARMVRTSIDIAESKGVLGAGYIPKVDQTNCTANSKGLFAYYRVAETGFVLTCRMPDGSGSGWAGITGIKDIRMIDAAALTQVAADKALRSRAPRAIEPGRYTVILEPRANARFLSLMTGIFGGGRWWWRWRRRWSCRRRRWGWCWSGRWRRGRVHGQQEARRQDLRRPVHAEERHRQSDPAPDADPPEQPAGTAGHLGRERDPAQRGHRRGRDCEHEPGARGLGSID
jgi:predicted Zn-dependent protease